MDEPRTPDDASASVDTPTQDMPGRERSVEPRRAEEVPNDGDLDVGDPPTGAFVDEVVDAEARTRRQD